jgi:hypothetical protein
MSTPQDNYGYFGPEYSFADNVPLPGQIGVRQDPSVGAIIDSVAGVNFYVDTIAFGGPTFFDSHNPVPMGIRYFLNSGMRCSNGATMSAYFDGVTKGDLLGDNVANALASAGLPGLKGLAPGMLENARDALDPRPILSAVTASGYPVCQQVQCPVGDIQGNIVNPQDANAQPYIIDPVQYTSGMPYQTRWVQAYDSTGSQIQITKDEFGATPKCYNADGTYQANPPNGCPPLPGQPQGVGAQDPYGLCTMIQPAAMPPTLNQSGAEGFRGDDMEEFQRIAMAVGVAALGGIALWAFQRR